MRKLTSIMRVLVAAAGATLGAIASASAPSSIDAAALQAYAGKPWDKAALMNTTIDVGRYRNVPVVADAMLPKTFCIPEPLAASGQYLAH